MLKVLYFLLLSANLLFVFACGSGRSNFQTLTPATPPSITIQPTNQTSTIGATSTFTVVAYGATPLSYQWNWNGMAIVGATSDSFTTPAAVPSDNQSIFSVIVTNQIGTVTSVPATLSIIGSPRPPKLGDLRFKDVDAFPLGISWTVSTNIEGGTNVTYPNQVGYPLQLGWPGPGLPTGNWKETSWGIAIGNLPLGAPARTTIYQTGVLGNFQSDLSLMASPNAVIASLDFCSGQNAYAIEQIQTTLGGGYSFGSQSLPPGALQVAATQEGAISRVITAVSLNAGRATYISYGWQGDPSTIYEASVVTATIGTLGSVATNLAQQGYIITAFGGNDTDGFLLVGTRVQGDITPRLLWVPPGSPGRGYAIVMSIFIYNPNNVAASTQMYISEM